MGDNEAREQGVLLFSWLMFGPIEALLLTRRDSLITGALAVVLLQCKQRYATDKWLDMPPDQVRLYHHLISLILKVHRLLGIFLICNFYVKAGGLTRIMHRVSSHASVESARYSSDLRLNIKIRHTRYFHLGF